MAPCLPATGAPACSVRGLWPSPLPWPRPSCLWHLAARCACCGSPTGLSVQAGSRCASGAGVATQPGSRATLARPLALALLPLPAGWSLASVQGPLTLPSPLLPRPLVRWPWREGGPPCAPLPRGVPPPVPLSRGPPPPGCLALPSSLRLPPLPPPRPPCFLPPRSGTAAGLSDPCSINARKKSVCVCVCVCC